MQNFTSLLDITYACLSTVHMNNNYVGCPLRINRISVKDERLLIKMNIDDIFKTRLRVS